MEKAFDPEIQFQDQYAKDLRVNSLQQELQETGRIESVDNMRYEEAMRNLDEKYPNKDYRPNRTTTVDFNIHEPEYNFQSPFDELLEFEVLESVDKLKSRRRYKDDPNAEGEETSEVSDMGDGI